MKTTQANKADAENLLKAAEYPKNVNQQTWYIGGQKFTGYPFYSKWRRSKIDGVYTGMPEVITAEDWGFQVVIGNGGIIAPTDTVITFPIYATENDFTGAFSRMEKYLKFNFEYLPGLPAFSNSWD